MILIRNEEERDFKWVEEITRAAFWNLYVPGCTEHYLAHTMRSHEDFIRELDFVIEADGEVVGNIMYTKAKLIDESGEEKDILTFGPVSILPAYQRKGYGKKLMEHSFAKASALGYDVIVIFGNPGNYVSSGFESCKKHNVCTPEGVYPAAMLVKELRAGALDGRKWAYHQSSAYEFDQAKRSVLTTAWRSGRRSTVPARKNFISSAMPSSSKVKNRKQKGASRFPGIPRMP